MIKNNWQPLFLGFLSFLTRFIFLGYPSKVVFDEIYFGSYVKEYFTHSYFYNDHPPLGKLIIYFFAKIFGLSNYADFNSIGQMINGSDGLILRFMPAFFGALFVLLIYYLILKIGLSKKAAFMGATLVLFDNAVLVQSKLILLDIFLLFFGFLSFYFLLWFKGSKQGSKKSYIFLALAVTSAGLSFSVKWTGLSFVGIVGVFFLMDVFKNFNIKRVFINFLIITILPFLIYFCIFAVHFSLLTKSGLGDAYMNQDFWHINISQKFFELNQKMYFYTSTLKATHPYSSKWYQWPLDKRPIWYWSQQSGDKISNIFLIGNPVVWWAVIFSVLISCGLLFFKSFRKNLSWIFYVLILGYFANLLPFILIGRVTFLYHYLSSLIFGILILVFLCDKFMSGKKYFSNFYWSFISLVFLAFIIISPISYGFPLPINISHFYNYFVNFFL